MPDNNSYVAVYLVRSEVSDGSGFTYGGDEK